MNILQKIAVFIVWLPTVILWVLFTWGIRIQKRIMGDSVSINYWKYNDVQAIFLKNGRFEHKDNINSFSFRPYYDSEKKAHFTNFIVNRKDGNIVVDVTVPCKGNKK